MTVPLAVSDIWSATVACYQGAQVALNRYRFIVNSLAGTGTNDATLAAGLDGIFAPLYKLLMTNSATYYGVRLIRKTPSPGFVAQLATGHTGVGTAGTKPMPLVVCGLLKFNSPAFGRKGRGRVYIPFPDTTANTTFTPNAAYQTALANLGAALINPFTVGAGGNTATLQLVIAGRLATSPGFLVGTATGEPEWGSQHKRGDWGKPNVIPPF